MANYSKDKRIVLTLDAGGTNFVFGAIQGGREIVQPISKPSNASELDKCLATLIEGFTEVNNSLPEKPSAISFAFPGPADYPKGIIGDLPNFPSFKGGVALGPFLEAHFNLPVFINNDGNLFAYGEALAGILPEINTQLREAGSTKQYTNLIGLTLGTGLGCGLVFNNQLLQGDNSIAAEVWLLSNRVKPEWNAEEIISTKSLIAEYKKHSSDLKESLMPVDIYNIALGKKEGNKQAALNAFNFFGKGLGDVAANLITLFDAIVVIGGGISAAKELYMPSMLSELNRQFESRSGEPRSRLVQKIFDLNDEKSKLAFLTPSTKKIPILGSTTFVDYDPLAKIAIAHSELGASKAIQFGAYVFALNKLDT